MPKSETKICIGIYFPTYGSGGARRHLTELLLRWGGLKDIRFIVYGPMRLQGTLPIASNIEFQRVEATEKSILHRFMWELFLSKKVFSKLSVLFVPLGSYVGFAKPIVTMSRNLMLYDKNEIDKIDRLTARLSTHLNRYVQLLTFRNASRIIFISRYACEWICDMHHSFKPKSRIVHHGIAREFYMQERKHWDIITYSREQPFTLLYVSSFYEYKNHKILLEAIARIALKYPVQLFLIGTFPDIYKENEYMNLFKKYNSSFPYEIIRYFPELGLTDVIQYYHSADMFVFPSAVENMPNVLVEAMAAGLPIASSDLQPMPEFLGDCGVYFKTDDSACLEFAILSLIRNCNARKRYSEMAKKRAKLFSWDTTSEDTLKILKETCSAK